jgi:hypothetical protein
MYHYAGYSRGENPSSIFMARYAVTAPAPARAPGNQADGNQGNQAALTGHHWTWLTWALNIITSMAGTMVLILNLVITGLTDTVDRGNAAAKR